MALTGKITLESGLELKSAVVIVSSLSDSNGSQYNLDQRTIEGGRGVRHIDDRPTRSTGYSAIVYMSEEKLRAGAPPIGNITESGSTYLQLKPTDDDNKLELVALAYADIKKRHAGLADLDLNDLDII